MNLYAGMPRRLRWGRFLLVCLPFAAGGCWMEGTLPDPIEARRSAINAELAAGRSDAPPAALSVDEAVRYALGHNLSLRVAELENAIQRELQTGATLKMLPSLRLAVDQEGRNRPNASYSESLATGSVSLAPSISTEQHTNQYNVALVWNVLDFGLSMVRARQAGERLRMADWQVRRVRQQVAMDVAAAYWQAVAAEQTAREAEAVAAALEELSRVFQNQLDSAAISHVERGQKELVILAGLRMIGNLKLDARTARLQLARAMGLGDADLLSLPALDMRTLPTPPAGSDLDKLQRLALYSRAELYQQDAQARISYDDATAALLQMFPSISLFLRADNDQNKYLTYDTWQSAGATLAWDLLSIPARTSDRNAARLQAEAAKARGRLAAVAILVQVNLAATEYRDVLDRVRLSERIVRTRAEVIGSLSAGMQDGTVSETDVVLERLRHLGDLAVYRLSYADALGGYARLQNALGLDPDAGTGAMPALPLQPVAPAAPVLTMVDERADFIPMVVEAAAAETAPIEATPVEAVEPIVAAETETAVDAPGASAVEAWSDIVPPEDSPGLPPAPTPTKPAAVAAPEPAARPADGAWDEIAPPDIAWTPSGAVGAVASTR